jgi:hypothetical protein
VADEPPDDYFAAVAQVVEAARQAEEAARRVEEAKDAHMRRFQDKQEADKALRDALENLTKVNVGRGRNGKAGTK